MSTSSTTPSSGYRKGIRERIMDCISSQDTNNDAHQMLADEDTDNRESDTSFLRELTRTPLSVSPQEVGPGSKLATTGRTGIATDPNGSFLLCLVPLIPRVLLHSFRTGKNSMIDCLFVPLFPVQRARLEDSGCTHTE